MIAASVGYGQRADAAEQLVPGAAALARELRASRPANWSMSAPAAKTNGLPVSTIAGPVAVLELGEEPLAATRARARPNVVGFV